MLFNINHQIIIFVIFLSTNKSIAYNAVVGIEDKVTKAYCSCITITIIWFYYASGTEGTDGAGRAEQSSSRGTAGKTGRAGEADAPITASLSSGRLLAAGCRWPMVSVGRQWWVTQERAKLYSLALKWMSVSSAYNIIFLTKRSLACTRPIASTTDDLLAADAAAAAQGWWIGVYLPAATSVFHSSYSTYSNATLLCHCWLGNKFESQTGETFR